jgi:hypothetical protein
MMNKQQLDTAYAELCRKLGHATINLKHWEAEKVAVMEAIDQLNTLAKMIQESTPPPVPVVVPKVEATNE